METKELFPLIAPCQGPKGSAEAGRKGGYTETGCKLLILQALQGAQGEST